MRSRRAAPASFTTASKSALLQACWANVCAPAADNASSSAATHHTVGRIPQCPLTGLKLHQPIARIAAVRKRAAVTLA